MSPVSEAFLEAMAAAERQVLARVTIDYTDPFMDQSIEIEASEQADVSWPLQTADTIDTVPHKWLSLDGSCAVDGTYHLVPTTQEDADRYQMGWWGRQLAGEGGAFSEPYPALTATHFARPVHRLWVVGDSARGEYPVDSQIDLYAPDDVLLHRETVVGNSDVHWLRVLPVPVLDVVRQVLTITRWSHEGRQVKVAEFFTSVQQTYEASDLLEISLLEEREVNAGILPVGAISANEIAIRIRNDDRRFAADNPTSPLYRLLKPNRRVRAWLGAPRTATAWMDLAIKRWEEL